MRNKQQKGFTLIELLVVIAIIGLLASVVLLALNSARAKSRDAKRLADIRQVVSAMELYFNDAGGYPSTIASITTTGNPGATAYLGAWPLVPSPQDGGCAAASNTYTYTASGTATANGSYPDYRLTFCLGATTGGIGSGVRTASPAGIQ